jgi:hypothetical protein
MKLQASSDTSELTNVHTPDKQIGQPPCACGGFGDDDDGGALGEGIDGDSSDGARGCNTTSSSNTSDMTLVLLACAGGIAIIRSRRRRRG